MRIDELDRNLRVDCDVADTDIVWLPCREAPFALHGVQYDAAAGCFTRMPSEVAKTVSDGVAYLNTHASGGRVRFRTDSDIIAIRAVMRNQGTMPHMTCAGSSGFDLYGRTEDMAVPTYVGTFMPSLGMQGGYASSRSTSGKMTEYTINFPLYDCVEELYIALRRGALLEEPTPYRNERPVVFYGSSITQGGCASRPGNSYQSFLSRWLCMDYINLGFSGNGKAEDSMIAYLASLPMSVFVCDYDHNAPNAAHLQATHYPLYAAVRRAHPDIPILLLSAPDVLRAPAEFEPRREVIRETYRRALAEGDRNVYFLDGGSLFGDADMDACTVDGCHPNDLGFYRMAVQIKEVLAPLLP